jgi:hypothetical protein
VAEVYGLWPTTTLRLLRNDWDHVGSWLELDLRGTRSNRDAVGARVVLEAGGRSQLRLVQGATGSVAQSARRVHFGVDAKTVDAVTITWPSGATQRLPGPINPGQRITVVEP